MSTTVIVTIQAIIAATQIANIGTNLGLANLIWAMVNGSCLTSRGAIFTALHGLGLEAITVRHSWAALRYGAWLINELLGGWQEHVIQEGQWTERRYEEWRVISLDITAVPRPRLKNWPGKLYDGKVGRAVPAVGVGLRVIVGQVAGKRLALLSTIVRCEPTQNVSQPRLCPKHKGE